MKNLPKNFFALLFAVSLGVTAYSQTNTFPSSGNVGIGTTSPSYKLHVVQNGWKARFSGTDGYINIGPANSGFAHIYTDRPNFIFNKPVYSKNGFLSYSSTLNLEAASGYYVQIKPRSSSYGLILREYNSSDYGNIEVTSSGLGLGYNKSGYDLLIKTDGDVLIRDDLFFNMGNVFGFGSGQGNNRLTIHHTGTHGYIDYKDNLHFRADLNWVSSLILQGDGNVAIGYGTTYSTDGTQYQTHGYKLGVNGDIYVENGWLRVSGQRGIYFQDYGGGFYMTDNTWIRTYNNKNFYHNSGIMRTDGTFQVGSNGNRFIVNSSGNVGIGTTGPDCKLDVNGKIRAEEIEVITDVPDADYIFEADYNLKSLSEVEAFIKENKHLPNIPSAKQFKTDGYKVGEMDEMLLRKVEEMTLYLIEQNKRIEALEEENKELKAKVNF